MSYDDALFEAIEAVLDLGLPDEACPDAFNGRAALLAGIESDDIGN